MWYSEKHHKDQKQLKNQWFLIEQRKRSSSQIFPHMIVKKICSPKNCGSVLLVCIYMRGVVWPWAALMLTHSLHFRKGSTTEEVKDDLSLHELTQAVSSLALTSKNTSDIYFHL